MKRTVATRLADALAAMAIEREMILRIPGAPPCVASRADLRRERETLLKASVELRRLAAKKGKKKQAKVGA